MIFYCFDWAAVAEWILKGWNVGTESRVTAVLMMEHKLHQWTFSKDMNSQFSTSWGRSCLNMIESSGTATYEPFGENPFPNCTMWISLQKRFWQDAGTQPWSSWYTKDPLVVSALQNLQTEEQNWDFSPWLPYFTVCMRNNDSDLCLGSKQWWHISLCDATQYLFKYLLSKWIHEGDNGDRYVFENTREHTSHVLHSLYH